MNRAISEIVALRKHPHVKEGDSLDTAMQEALNRLYCAPSDPCANCGGRSDVDMARFREHALKLRDEGATNIVVGAMSVEFLPKYPAPPLTPESVAAALEAKQPAEPEGDERYLP